MPDLLVSAVDCNIDLLDTLTLSVLVAQTARDLKKSPRKLLFKPSAAALILLLRVVSPMLAATFLADLWFAQPLSPALPLLPVTLVGRFGAVAIRLAISILVSVISSSIFPDIAKEDKSD